MNIKIKNILLLTTFMLIHCSCSSLDTFGKTSFISVKHYKDSRLPTLTRIEDRHFEYVKNGEKNCFDYEIIGRDVYTVKSHDLEEALYLLNSKNENWLFKITSHKQDYLRQYADDDIQVTPLQSPINYEYVNCKVKFLGFSIDYNDNGVNDYVSFFYIPRK